jgi:hypothetical protein
MEMGRRSGATQAHTIRTELRQLLEGGHAHPGFDDAVAGFPARCRARRPEGLPYSGWELLEHLRIAQWDILEFIRNPDHVSPAWPAEYWPGQPVPPDPKAWDRSVRAFRADRRAILAVLADPGQDLLGPIPHGTGQTLFRELLLVADHSAYHIAQMIGVRRLLGAWTG